MRRTIALTLIAALIFSQNAFAQSTEEIAKRLEELEQQVAILKRQLEVKKEEEEKKAADTPIITANAKDGFSIKSQDEAFKLRVRGLVQADSRIFTGDKNDQSPTTDTFLIRRARPIFEGTVGKSFDFYLMPDLANNASNQAQLVDAYIDFKIKQGLKVRGGKSKAPFGLERLQSDAVANFIETGLPSNLVPNRDVGFQLIGDSFSEAVSYQLGVFNGGADLASVDTTDNNNDKDLIGRVFAHPFKNNGPESLKGLGVGVAGSYGHKEGSSIPTYRSPGQASVFSYASGVSADGEHVRISPQAYLYKGSGGVLAEYVTSEQKLVRTGAGAPVRDTFNNKAWQISGNYALTGELASYKGISPRNNFDLDKGTWGAFEIVGRYGQLDLDDEIFDNAFASANTAITKENSWGTGLNWYPHKNVKIALNYEHTEFEGGATGGEDRRDENVILTRLQLSY